MTMLQAFRYFVRKPLYQTLIPSLIQAPFSRSAKNKTITNKHKIFDDEIQEQPTTESPLISNSISFTKTRNLYSEKENSNKQIIRDDDEAPKFLRTPLKTQDTELGESNTSRSLEESGQERLSKRLSRLGVCSRRQAEKIIQSGIVKVNDKQVLSNVPVTDNDIISVFTKHGEKIPMKEDTKIWMFHKPRGLICTHSDPQGRKTIFEYLREIGFKDEHFISVGRLDFLSEGLILLTNDGDLAQSLEQPHSNIERTYRVRIFGRFDEVKLDKIRKGVTIKGIKYGPYFVEIEKRQTRNTWLRMRLRSGKNREIRRVMQKFSLRVDRLQRVKYGPYTLQGLETGNWAEVPITPEVKRVAYLGLRKKLEQKQLDYQAQKQLGESPSVPQISYEKPKLAELEKPKNNILRIEGSAPRAKLVIKKLKKTTQSKS